MWTALIGPIASIAGSWMDGKVEQTKAKARREAIRRQKEMMENIKLAAGVGMVMALGIGLLIFLLTIV